MLRDGVKVKSGTCLRSECRIILRDGDAELEIFVVAKGKLSYITEFFTSERTHERIIVKSEEGTEEVMYIGLHAHRNAMMRFRMIAEGEDVRISYDNIDRVFGHDGNHELIENGSVGRSIAPMEAVPLEFNKRNRLRENAFVGDAGTFYDRNGADFQRVFTFTAMGRKSWIDAIHTCSRFNNVRTRIMVVRCLDETQYTDRECKIVSYSGTPCDELRSNFRGKCVERLTTRCCRSGKSVELRRYSSSTGRN